MKRLTDFIDRHPKAFYIAFIYVGLGTLAVCSVYPKDFFYGQWSLLALIITLPVSVVSFGYRYGEADVLYPVFIIQIIMFLLTYWIASRWEDKQSSD